MLLDEVADVVAVAVGDRNHVLRQLRVEASDRLVEVAQRVRQNHRHRKARGSVDPDDFATGELVVRDHLVQTLLGVLHDLIVLRRSAEPDLQSSVFERDVVRVHDLLLRVCAGFGYQLVGFGYHTSVISR